MKVVNAVTPTREQLKGFGDDPHAKPISMVNLLKFKAQAAYPEGHELHGKEMTGAEAYALYTDEVTKILNGLGGEMFFLGQVERLMLGEVEELWDVVAIAKYPSRAAMGQMIASPEYQEIAVHRSAGLAGQLNIECTEQGLG